MNSVFAGHPERGGVTRIVAGSAEEVVVPRNDGASIVPLRVLQRLAKAGVVRVDVLHWTQTHLVRVKREDELAAFLPRACNLRDPTDGKTLLHRFLCNDEDPSDGAAMRSDGAAMRSTLRSWLSTEGIVYTPISDAGGSTVLQLAVKRRDRQVIRTLLTHLSPTLNSHQGALLTAALRQMAEFTPELVPWALKKIESSVLHAQKRMRVRLTAGCVCGSDAYTAPSELWDGIDEESELENDVVSTVLILRDMVGEPSLSPFWLIVEKCDAAVFDTKIVERCVAYKWQTNVFRQLIREVAVHVAYVVLVSSAITVVSVRLAECRALPIQEVLTEAEGMVIGAMCGQPGWVDVMVAVSAIGLALKTAREVWQVWVIGLFEYAGSVWNLIDIGSCVFCALGLAGHVEGRGHVDGRAEGHDELLVGTFGALGVMFLWLGLLDYFRAFESTGPLIRMIFQIFHDIWAFMAVLGVGCIAFTFFFVIHQPLSRAFTLFDELGVAWPLLTTYRLAVLGEYEMDTFSSIPSLVVFVACSIFSTILLLNLLIAIMGDSY